MNEKTIKKSDEIKTPIKQLNGVEYFDIPLKAETGEEINIRLFNSLKSERLEFETNYEYKIRRSWNYRNTKSHLKGKLMWNSYKLGSLNKKSAFRELQKYKNEKK